MVDVKICVPYYNVIEEETQQAIYDLLDSEEVNCAYLSIQGTNIANARNFLINEGKSDLIYQKINTNFTHFLFLDADIVPTVKTIQKLLSYDLDVVSAAYKSREQSYTFVGGIFKRNEDGEFLDALKLKSDCKGLMEVDWCGGGCILIKKEVLEKVAFPWFRYPIMSLTKNGNKHAKLVFEDVGFCMNLKDHGFKIYMDCDSQVQHLARNYNSNMVTDMEVVFKNVNDDLNKMFQLVRGVTYENKKLKDQIDIISKESE